MHRTDVQLHTGEEEFSGSFRMNFENAQAHGCVGGRIFLTVRWQDIFLVRIDSGVYKQGKYYLQGCSCAAGLVWGRGTGPGPSVYRH